MPLRMPLVAAAPLGPSERLDAIDALRGIALLGVLIINLVTEFRVSIFEQFLPHQSIQTSADRFLETLLMVIFAQKALALFSLLFGVGLAIQFERLSGRSDRLTLLLRRLAVLLAIGLVHLLLIWNGDILTEYAVAGFVVLPFLFGPRWLLAAAGIAFLSVYLLMPLFPAALAFPSQGWMTQHAAEARRVYGEGTFAEVLRFRIQEIPAILTLHLLIFPRTVGLFLLGAFMWRTGLLRNAAAHRFLLFRAAAAFLLVGAGLSAMSQGWTIPARSFGAAWLPVERSLPIILALGYAATVLAVFTTGWRKVFAWAAPLGRMAFTNYLLQSIIFGWIFYGYGLGLFGSIGVAAALAIGLPVYILQAFISRWWLRHYRFGPVEWLWRTLMYGNVQPLRILPSRL
jgi:uncharacterized protein